MAKPNLFALHHEITGDDGTSRKLVTVIDGNSISVEAEGYNTCNIDDDCKPGTGITAPVMIEAWDGELRVIVWGDINQEDPTHIISLEGARKSERDDDDYENF